MAEKRGACPLKAGTLTKGFTPLLETEGKEAEKGDWNDGTREAELPRGGRGRFCPSPSSALPTPHLPTCLPHFGKNKISRNREEYWSTNLIVREMSYGFVF